MGKNKGNNELSAEDLVVIQNVALMSDNEISTDFIETLGYNPDCEDVKDTLEGCGIKIIKITDATITNLSPSEEYTYLVKAQAGDEDSYLKMIKAFTPLMNSMAWKHHTGDNFEDLKQEAFIALHSAIHSFDVTKGKYRFGVYAKRSIANALIEHYRKNSGTIKVTAYAKIIIDKINDIADLFGIEADESWSEEAIKYACKELEMKEDKLKEYISYSSLLKIASMERIVENQKKTSTDGDFEFAASQNIFSDGEELSVEDEAQRNEASNLIKQLIATLPETEQIILVNYYGFIPNGVTQKKALAEMTGISEYQVEKAISDINFFGKKFLKNKKYKKFNDIWA